MSADVQGAREAGLDWVVEETLIRARTATGRSEETAKLQAARLDRRHCTVDRRPLREVRWSAHRSVPIAKEGVRS